MCPGIAATRSWFACLSVLQRATTVPEVGCSRSISSGKWNETPIIIGGTSDSGTRGALFIFHTFYVEVCRDFMSVEGDDMYLMNAIGPFMPDLGHTVGLLGRHINQLPVDWQAIRKQPNLSADILNQLTDRVYNAIQSSWECAGKPSGPWGIKAPRTISALSVLNHVLGGEFKFVHVIRDPRATCKPSAHRVSYFRLCAAILGRPCNDSEGDCFRYWARQNLYARRFFSSVEEASGKYFLMAMEDVVGAGISRGAQGAQRHLLMQAAIMAGWPPSEAARLNYQHLELEEQRHASSYEANAHEPWSTSLQGLLASVVQDDADVASAMHEFGYSVTHFGRKPLLRTTT